VYLELLQTELGVQGTLCTAYVASGRSREVGMLALALNSVARAFFEEIEPPEACADVHRAFLRWQELGIDALAEELKDSRTSDGERGRRFAEAAGTFRATLAAFETDAKMRKPVGKRSRKRRAP
jgi:hypothetical protein